MANQERQEEIDYLHPDGKPIAQRESSPAIFNAEDLAEEQARKDKALEEADGHHVCSEDCQLHHEVIAKGADKTKP